MKLLIITQKVDKGDPVLGFFHNWVAELSKRFEFVSVICLEKGQFNLPHNVKVYSLGKESKKSRIKYISNFYNYIVGLHKDYDVVFVHMNQEYMLLGGIFWKLLRKKVYFWRNHPHGNMLTRAAVAFANKVFSTSTYSYTARFKKVKIMPVGIDIDRFIDRKVERFKNSILFIARMSPIKKPDKLIGALEVLNNRGIEFSASFYGDPLPKDEEYYQNLKNSVEEGGLEDKIKFFAGVPNDKTPDIYSIHKIFVNLTPSGSFDKTILEAAACGALPVVVNESLRGEIKENLITSPEPEKLADTLRYWLQKTDIEQEKEELKKYVLEKHSLHALMDKICSEIKK
jgi:glycosyltransferase involved in cell wall biosynthesis